MSVMPAACMATSVPVDMAMIMATGGGLTTALSVGQRLGIDEIHGEVKPADKLKRVEKLQRAAWWRWRGMTSTPRRRWPTPMWASPWHGHPHGDKQRPTHLGQG